MKNEFPGNMEPKHAAGYAQLVMKRENLYEKKFYYRGKWVTIYAFMTLSDIEEEFEEATGGDK